MQSGGKAVRSGGRRRHLPGQAVKRLRETGSVAPRKMGGHEEDCGRAPPLAVAADQAGDFTLRGLLDRVEPVPLSVPNTPRDALAIRNNR
jgi:hypothetical protein